VMEGRRKLAIEWDDGPNAAHDSSTYDDKLRESARAGGEVIRNRGDVDKALAGADKVVEAEYFVPYFIHTPMEPPAAIVDANVRPVQIWASTQSPNETRQYVAEALGVEKTDVECQITLLGGGFGRKSKPDYVCEAAILSNVQHAQRFIEVLHGIGCEFSLDDFGSGLGSFSSLKHLPIDYLKIDGTYTRNLRTDLVNQEMVNAMIKLARTMEFKIVAEQVEHQEDFDWLRDVGVDFVQGHFVEAPAILGSSGTGTYRILNT